MADTQLTINDVRQQAIESNRAYLSAKEDVSIAQSEITRAWADALPDISFDANYNRHFTVPSIFFVADGETVELQTGFKNSFGAQISARQSLWHGGKVLTALQIARLYKSYSLAVASQMEAEVLYNAERLFYSAILARAQLDLWQQALESNTANLEVVEKLFAQGMVSEYEVLRAKVEKQNIIPRLLGAESELRMSHKRLKSFLGIELDEAVVLVEDQTDTSIDELPSPSELTASAYANRPEIEQAEDLAHIAQKAVRIARADYWPSFDAVGAYTWQSASDDFTLSNNESSSWTAGLVVSFPIFTGGRTRGQVAWRKAQNNQAQLNLQQVRDDIALQVEEAYDLLIQASEALIIQETTIAAAEEGLRIANLRYESGVGTQLEVLSAQTALTQAREIQAQALFTFRLARSGLKKATSIALDMDTKR